MYSNHGKLTPVTLQNISVGPVSLYLLFLDTGTDRETKDLPGQSLGYRFYKTLNFNCEVMGDLLIMYVI